MKYRRDKNQYDDNLDSNAMSKKTADPVKIKFSKNNKDITTSKPRHNSQPSRSDESETAAFLHNGKHQTVINNKDIKRSKRGTSANSRGESNNGHKDLQKLSQKKSSSSKKLAKITNNNNGYQGGNRQITSPARQKRQVHTTVYAEDNLDFNRNEENILFQINQQNLIQQQQRQSEQNANVWINRKTNQIVYNLEEEYDNDDIRYYKPKNTSNVSSKPN